MTSDMKQVHCTKVEVSHQGFFSKCDQIRKKLRIWSYLLKKSLMENFIFYAVVNENTQLLPCPEAFLKHC